MGQPHKHAEIIKAWADGAEIEWLWKRPDHQEWVPCPETDPPTWNEEIEFRIKPEPPKYPQTKMNGEELFDAFYDVLGHKCTLSLVAAPGVHLVVDDGFIGIANAAIARAIEDGDVVPAAMLENVAKDAAAYGYNQAGGHRGLYLGSDFYDLIAKVKEGK